MFSSVAKHQRKNSGSSPRNAEIHASGRWKQSHSDRHGRASTGERSGTWTDYVVDYIVPLEAGGQKLPAVGSRDVAVIRL